KPGQPIESHSTPTDTKRDARPPGDAAEGTPAASGGLDVLTYVLVGLVGLLGAALAVWAARRK
ncbi:MAG TPA: hypothetical protein VNZ52_01525, partial [Candidatus Thermoplasmatota archaeon]|nr:hypothetical protein [Candidatus Thermoplasmatota archaeon]